MINPDLFDKVYCAAGMAEHPELQVVRELRRQYGAASIIDLFRAARDIIDAYAEFDENMRAVAHRRRLHYPDSPDCPQCGSKLCSPCGHGQGVMVVGSISAGKP